MAGIKIVPREMAAPLLQELPGLTPGILFGGDRFACCDEALVWEDEGGDVLGLATLSPVGEGLNREPTIVGLFVLPRARRGRIGERLLHAAIRRMKERGFEHIRVDVLSSRVLHMIKRLPEELRFALQVHDLHASGLDLVVQLEERQTQEGGF